MDTWLKKFFKGTYIAYWMIIVVGVVFITLWLLIAIAVITFAWFKAVAPLTTNNIIIMLCVFFVVVFGLVWSSWD